MTTRFHVDRLALSLGGMSETDVRRLVPMIATHLASASPTEGPAHIDHLRINMNARPDEPLDATARRIAAEVLRAVARSQ
ncbi:MAG TPA: hypothetical protein VL326_14510 [Kofleriaceae bacterium]|jgi:hypothetical protein|nr:hypothetical protein [Kofleriaceae bacterium]